jgi:hypothetical protein
MEEPWTANTIPVGNESHKAGLVPSIHGMWRVMQMKETACSPSPTYAHLLQYDHTACQEFVPHQIVDKNDYKKGLL